MRVRAEERERVRSSSEMVTKRVLSTKLTKMATPTKVNEEDES